MQDDRVNREDSIRHKFVRGFIRRAFSILAALVLLPAAFTEPANGENREFWERRPDPGRATPRRLNRAEYQNAVRDLLGLELAIAETLPLDSRGGAFDFFAPYAGTYEIRGFMKANTNNEVDRLEDSRRTREVYLEAGPHSIGMSFRRNISLNEQV